MSTKNDAVDINKKRTKKAIEINKKYRPEYCQMLIDHMKHGFSFSTFGQKINCVRATIYNWLDKYPEFKAAKDIGDQKAQDFMEQRLTLKLSGQGMGSVDPKKIDVTALIFALKTRFHRTYGDKQKIEQEISSKDDSVKIEFVKAKK